MINIQQDTPFFFDTPFFNQFLHYPGGLADYASAFLSQFFIYPWLGALVIALLAFSLYLLTSRMMALCGSQNMFLVSLIPVVLMGMLHSNYKHTLSVNLGLLSAIFFFVLYVRIYPRKHILRFALYLLMAGLLYYMMTGHLLLFVLLVALFELIYLKQPLKRRILMILFYLIIGIVIPLLSRTFIFMMTYNHAYFYTLPFHDSYKPVIAPAVLYLTFPMILVLRFVRWKKLFGTSAESLLNRFKLSDRGIQTIVQVLIFLISIYILLFVSFDRNHHIVLQMYRYSELKMWPEIIELAKHSQAEDIRITFFTNRALYHTGRFPDEMFSLPQKWGGEGLFLPERFTYEQPMLKSDIFLEMGYVNESQRMAHEGLSQQGETLRILQRLALINLLKGDKYAAEMFFSKLDNTLFYKLVKKYETVFGQ